MSDALLLYGVVALALAFDFTNGFHDTANAIATSVSTRALSPRRALAIAAVMNFLGAFTSTAVATTIGTGIVRAGSEVGQDVLVAALVGAIVWNVLTWYVALPSSSSYALIGGLLGGALVADGLDGVQWDELVGRVLVPAILSPIAGFAAAYALLVAAIWLVRDRRPRAVNTGFRGAQVVAGSLMAFAHGTNDAQKTMGVIGLALLAAGETETFTIPLWVVVASATVLALGTYAGGGRIMRTLGYRAYRLEPPHGFAAQASATGVLLATAAAGAPVSTTHVIAGGVFGAGSTARLGHVRWGVAREIVLAWILTLPAAALIAAAIMLPIRVL